MHFLNLVKRLHLPSASLRFVCNLGFRRLDFRICRGSRRLHRCPPQWEIHGGLDCFLTAVGQDILNQSHAQEHTKTLEGSTYFTLSLRPIIRHGLTLVRFPALFCLAAAKAATNKQYQKREKKRNREDRLQKAWPRKPPVMFNPATVIMIVFVRLASVPHATRQSWGLIGHGSVSALLLLGLTDHSKKEPQTHTPFSCGPLGAESTDWAPPTFSKSLLCLTWRMFKFSTLRWSYCSWFARCAAPDGS